MPFCTKCGHQVQASDIYCRSCGAQQPVTSAGSTLGAGLPALSPQAASVLCYVPWLGWIAAVYVIASKQFEDLRDVRFHAYQGLYLFVCWLLADWAFEPWLRMFHGPARAFGALLQIAVLVAWVVMLVKTSRGERHPLPVIGDLAERSL